MANNRNHSNIFSNYFLVFRYLYLWF